MQTKVLGFVMGLALLSGAAQAADDVYLNVKIVDVSCKVRAGEGDQFTIVGLVEARRGQTRLFKGIEYKDRDSNYNFKLGPNKEGSHAGVFCEVLKRKAADGERAHLITQPCGYNCDRVRAVTDTTAHPGYGTGRAYILR